MNDQRWEFDRRPDGPPRRPPTPPARPGVHRPSALEPAPVRPPTSIQGSPASARLASQTTHGGRSAPEPGSPRPWGWRALFAFLAGGLLAASGFAAARQFYRADDGEVAAVTPVTTAAPIDDPAPSAPPIVVEPPDLDTSEPAAFVASLLGPSVVQIEIPNFGLGSGVVFDDGLILTNHHVIEGSTEVDVRTADGRLLAGEVLGSDPRTDIAVISVGEDSDLPVAQLAVGEPLEVGQLSIAIGSPFQLQQTVTLGIISSLNRPVFNGVGWNAMVQTDAAINPGNSGGALADRNGKVIGINTAIQTDGVAQGNVGVGFAVPIDTAMSIAGRILDDEPIEPGFLGVSGAQSTNGAAGVLVDEVTSGSAADLAGIEVGDLILTIDEAPVTSIEELAGLVQTKFPGDNVLLQVVRNGEIMTLVANLGDR